jgi:hypothetical protein
MDEIHHTGRRHGGNDKVCVVNLMGRHQFEDLPVEEGIILKCMLSKPNVRGGINLTG